jgi:hypothetical protein
VLTEAPGSRLVHPPQVERGSVPQGVAAAQRVSSRRIVAHPVGVAPPEGGEPGIETVRGRPDRAHPDLRREQPAEAADGGTFSGGPGFRRNVKVGDLAAGMHSAIGPARDGQRRSGRQAQHKPERVLEHPLDGPDTLLPRPAVESPAVVGHVDPKSDLTSHTSNIR